MPKIKIAGSREKEQLKHFLESVDLAYPNQSLANFWLLQKEQEIMAVVQLQDLGKFVFLSSLGVKETARHQGLASHLLKETLPNFKKDVYLYTIIPEFFLKFGFKLTKPIITLPDKNSYECDYCQPAKCVTMLRPAKSGSKEI